MHYQSIVATITASTLSIALAGCGGSESGSDAAGETIKLGGPLSLAASTAQPAEDGTVPLNTTLTNLPAGIEADFATRYPGYIVEERYRQLDYSGGTLIGEQYGLEGEAADDSEVEASYSAEGNFLAAVTSVEDITLPPEILQVLETQYPGAEFDDIEQITDESGNISYEVEIESGSAETELLMDSLGNVLSSAEEIPQSMLPAAVLQNLNAEIASFAEAEFERITASDGSVRYEAELEGRSESVNMLFSETGELLQIQYIMGGDDDD